MSMLLHGRAPSVVTIARIADYLEVSVDYLLGRVSSPEEHYTPASIARNVANACTECGTTVPELLNACGLPSDTLKRAQAESISAVDLAKIADYLGTTTDKLVGR